MTVRKKAKKKGKKGDKNDKRKRESKKNEKSEREGTKKGGKAKRKTTAVVVVKSAVVGVESAVRQARTRRRLLAMIVARGGRDADEQLVSRRTAGLNGAVREKQRISGSAGKAGWREME